MCRCSYFALSRQEHQLLGQHYSGLQAQWHPALRPYTTDIVYDDPRIKILMQLSLQADTVDVKFIKRAIKTKVTLSHISHVFTLLISNVGLQNQTTTVKIELVLALDRVLTQSCNGLPLPQLLAEHMQCKMSEIDFSDQLIQPSEERSDFEDQNFRLLN